MDARLLKEKALHFFQKGKFAKAAEVWAQVCKADVRDNGSRLRLGDALAKAGQSDAAFDAYREAVDGFARQGFLPQAIAAAKLALALRPFDTDVQKLVTDFHAERLGRPSVLGVPGAVEPGPPPGAVQSGPSSPFLVNLVRSRPSAMVPGPPPMLGASPSRPRPEEPPVSPAVPESPVPVEAGLDDATPSPDEVPATSRSLGEDEPPTEATLPMLGRPPRLLPGVRRAEPAVAPPGPDADATLVPRQLPLTSGHPLLDAIQLRSTSSESTVFAANPFVRPAAPAEVAAADLGRFPHIPLFEELSREAFLALVQESPLRSLPAGEVILEQDAEGDRFYVICAGRVRVYREEPSGRRELAILEAGAFFGELAVLTGARRSAWVVAEVDDTRLLEVSASTLERLARRHPSVAEGLLSFARRRILSNVMSAEALFSGFKRSERQTWAERFGPRELQAGEVLLAPGAAPPGLVVVVSGQLQVSGGGRPGFALGPGALLGDVELLAGVVEAQVKAATRSSVLVLPVRDAEALLEHPSNVARRPELLEAGRRRSAG